jgi:hypothetical protein
MHSWALAGGLALATVLAGTAAARPLTILGSLEITGDGGTPLAVGALTGFAVIANPGLEKTIVQQLPPLTVPVFIDGEEADDSARSRPDDRPNGPPFTDSAERPRFRLLRRNLDTTVVLTNTTGATLVIELVLRSAAGDSLGGPRELSFAPHQTRAVQLSDLLP